MRDSPTNKMKLYKTKRRYGYKVKDIRGLLDGESWNEFWLFFSGKTGSIFEGELFVYRNVWEDFLKEHNVKTIDGRTIE